MAILRNAIGGLLGLLLLATSALCQTANILPNAKTQFLDANGKPLVGGQVFFYLPNTSTPKTTWSDAFQMTPNAQPVVLDSQGAAFIFGNGNYTETLYDSANNLIWSGFTEGVGAGTVIGPNTSVIGHVPQFGNITGTTLVDNASVSTAQNMYFGSGRPWCDVRAQGAVGDGSTDDTAAFVACVTALTAVNGGELRVPSGVYCLFSGLTISTTINIIGEALNSTELSTCSHDVTLLTLNYARLQARELSLIGSTNVGTVHDTIAIGASCITCRLDRIYGAYGRYAINNAGNDVHVSDIDISSTYGGAVLYTTGGVYCTRCKIDQSFPVQTPSVGYTISAWTSSHSYSKGDIVSTSGYQIQANNAGTSGGSAPTVLGYGLPIADGITGSCPSPGAGVCWYLVRTNSTYSAVQVDTGAFDVNLTLADMSGSYDYGVNITGAVGGTNITDSFIGGANTYGIFVQNGFNTTITSTQIANCLQASCAGIFISGPGDDLIANNSIYNNIDGIVIDAGNNRTIANNLVSATTGGGGVGIFLTGSLLRHTITGNLVGTSQFGSTPPVGIQLNSAGIDYATVIGNQCAGATTCITNNSTGTHNLIESTPGTLITSPTFTKGPIMSLGSDATGDMYYRNSSGVLTRLPVCTGTNVIGASGGLPACVTQGGGGGAMTYLCTITASASASINNASPTSGSCPINSSYTSYMLVFQNLLPATNERILQLQIHSGGAYKSSGYITQQIVNVTNSAAATTYIPLTFPNSSQGASIANTAPGFSGTVIITTPSASALCMIYGQGSYLEGVGAVGYSQYTGYWNTAGVVDGFQVLMDSGNLTSGSILVYGIQ